MNDFCINVIEELENKLDEINIDFDSNIEMFENSINEILTSIAKVKGYVLERGFKNSEEEIHFFKHIKPRIVSKLIYFNSLYKIETKKPYGGNKVSKKYLNNELSKLKKFFDNNLDFYKYYRTNSTYLDHKYFIRGNYDVKLSLDSYYFESDRTFSTSHDFKVAKIIANDLIQVYLEDQIIINDTGIRINKCDRPTITWTSNKTSLIELIYALHSIGAFDSGNADIKVIASFFEKAFNIELGDFYHSYLEIKNRKISRTKFLDSLKESLLKKMEQQDEK